MSDDQHDSLRFWALVYGLLLVCCFAALLQGCGGDPRPRQEEAQDYILERFAQEGLEYDADIYVDWHPGPCIEAWYDEEHRDSCRVGRAWAFGPAGCWVEVVNRGAISSTSLAHEDLHCALWQDLGCPGHAREEWDLIATINAELLAMGL